VAVYADTADDADVLEVDQRHLQAVAAIETLRNPLIDTSYR